MHRYLIYFGYSGTRFLGLQKQGKRIPPHLITPEYLKNDEKTVQGALEAAIFTKLKPVNPVILYTSSRTDQGVHAISNSGHIDLEKPLKGSYYDPKVMTGLLNLYMREKGLDITVRRMLAVPGWFSARHDAVDRTYLYRLAVSKHNLNEKHNYGPLINKSRSSRRKEIARRKKNLRDGLDINSGLCLSSVTPLLTATDHDKILHVRQAFDPELFKAALSEMVGTHNFATFCNSQGFYINIKNEHGEIIHEKRDVKSFTKTIYSITVSKHIPWIPPSLDSNYDSLDFYNVVIHGRSFLHNQVRRMMGVALAVASGKLAPEAVSDLLLNPSTPGKCNYPGFAPPAPPHGLYLAKVDYNNKAMDYATEDVKKLPLGSCLCPRDDFDWVLGPGYFPDNDNKVIQGFNNTLLPLHLYPLP